MSRWTCHPCAADVEFDGIEEAADHMAAHGFEVERWPDGRPVIVDTTLEPYEFAAGPCHEKGGTDG